MAVPSWPLPQRRRPAPPDAAPTIEPLFPDDPPRPVRGGLLARVEGALVDRMEKAVNRAVEKRLDTARTQGASINVDLMLSGAYHTKRGVLDPTGVTFELLRAFADHCYPVAAIINRRVNQIAEFGQRAKKRGSYVEQAGFQVRLADEEEEPTEADLKRMRELERIILNCGTAVPPEAERNENWEPGFASFLRQTARDLLTLSNFSVRRWYSIANPNRLTAWAAEDSGRIRRVKPRATQIVRGVPIPEQYEATRLVAERITAVEVSIDGNRSGQILSEFTARELAFQAFNSVTTKGAGGYGVSMIQQALSLCTGHINAMHYNGSRFTLDSLPRGLLHLSGVVQEDQLQKLKLHWREMLSGVQGRWKTPVITTDPSKNAAVEWISLDPSSRDMEYHQWMFTLVVGICAIFGIHPEEVGLDALSPQRPPLAEASPESKLEYSQDSGLVPILRCLEQFIDREILAVLDDSGRYAFRWVGIGQDDKAQDAEATTAELSAGMTTPREVAARCDLKLADWLKDCPALDIPAPLGEGFQLMITLWQASQQASMQQQQQASQMQGQQFDQDSRSRDQQFQQSQQQAMLQQMGQGGAPGGPGGPPQAGAVPPNVAEMLGGGQGAPPTAFAKALARGARLKLTIGGRR